MFKEECEPSSIMQVQKETFRIKNGGGHLTVEGVDDGEQVCIYTTGGMQVGNGFVFNGSATIYTNLQKGNIAVVKVGEKSVKIMVK